MSRNLSFALVAVVIVGAGLLLYGGDSNNSGGNPSAELAAAIFSPQSGEVAVTGNLNCLPLKDGKPLGEGQCVMGLKGDDGKFYALNTTGMEDARGENLNKVRVIGTLAPANLNDPEAGMYQYDGVLTVRAIESN